MLLLFLEHQTCTNEFTEKGVWASRTAFELRMKLRSNEPGMVCQFYDFNQSIICRTSANNHPMRFHSFAILIIELVAMAMALKNDCFSIRLIGFCARSQATHPIPQTHRATFVRN